MRKSKIKKEQRSPQLEGKEMSSNTGISQNNSLKSAVSKVKEDIEVYIYV